MFIKKSIIKRLSNIKLETLSKNLCIDFQSNNNRCYTLTNCYTQNQLSKNMPIITDADNKIILLLIPYVSKYDYHIENIITHKIFFETYQLTQYAELIKKDNRYSSFYYTKTDFLYQLKNLKNLKFKKCFLLVLNKKTTEKKYNDTFELDIFDGIERTVFDNCYYKKLDGTKERFKYSYGYNEPTFDKSGYLSQKIPLQKRLQEYKQRKLMKELNNNTDIFINYYQLLQQAQGKYNNELENLKNTDFTDSNYSFCYKLEKTYKLVRDVKEAIKILENQKNNIKLLYDKKTMLEEYNKLKNKCKVL